MQVAKEENKKEIKLKVRTKSRKIKGAAMKEKVA